MRYAGTVYLISMLIDVVMLRRDGEKVPRQQVLSAKPLRAELSVRPMPGGTFAQLNFPWHGALSPGSHVPTLQEPKLSHLRGDSFVLVGLEWVGKHHERRQVPQAWWCQLPREVA